MDIKAAVVKELNGNFQIENVVLDEPKANEVLVRIVASGICHSDATVVDGSLPLSFPAVLGHEGAGIVEKIGANVTTVEPGDHVVLGFAYCGHCDHCKQGLPAACVDFVKLNNSGIMKDGTTPLHQGKQDLSNFFGQSSFGTYSIADENNLVKVPKDIDLRLLGPLGCGLMTGSGTVLNNLEPKAGSSIVVFGTGAVGLAALMAGNIANCDKIIAVDLHDSRLELAKELGATHTINSKNIDVIEAIKEITDGKGADYAVDTTGVPVVIENALRSLAIKGKLATLAVSPKNISISPTFDLVIFSRTIVGVIEGDAVPQIYIPELINFYKKGKFPFDKLVKFYKFEEINEAFEDSENGTTIKPIIVLDESYTF